MIILQECLVSTDSVNFDRDGIPTTVAQPYPQLSKALDHTLNKKASKTYKTFASQHCSYSELLFLTAQSDAFYS